MKIEHSTWYFCFFGGLRRTYYLKVKKKILKEKKSENLKNKADAKRHFLKML